MKIKRKKKHVKFCL